MAGQRIPECGSDDGDTVDRKGHVNDTAAVLAVRPLHRRDETNLARDHQPVLGMVLRRTGIHAAVGPETGHGESLAVAFEPVAQDVEYVLTHWQGTRPVLPSSPLVPAYRSRHG